MRGAASAAPFVALSVGSGDPQQGLADGEDALEFRDGGVGWQGLPEIGVLRSAVCASAEEQAGWADGQVVEVGGVCSVRPGAAIEDEGVVTREDDAHAWSVL